MTKPALVMIHGLVGSLSYFQPQRLCARAEVQAWELLGYGARRDVEPDRLTLRSQTEHVAHRITRLLRPPVWVLGHSMGGAIAMLLADRHPELVRGVINVEGNFTLKDAFWSSRIIAQRPEDWDQKYRAMQRDPADWLAKCGVALTAERAAWAEEILTWQPAATVYAMSQALVSETGVPAYLEAVQRVLDRGLPLDLIAGEKSAAAWDVPEFVRKASRSYTEMPRVGHLMMLEAPAEFCRLVDSCRSSRSPCRP